MSTSTPSIPELRARCQPDSVLGRVNGEHWAGRVYMRHVSLRLTRQLLRTRLSADAVTWAMIASGVLAALALTVPGTLPAVVAVALVQAQLLLDCSDGEVARWRGTCSAVGVYLDRVGHYTTEAALVAALGVRADGGWGSLGGWTTWGLLTAVLVLVVKAETDLVHVARAHSGLPLLTDRGPSHRGHRTRRVRAVLRRVPFYRALIAMELTVLALLAALVDLAVGDLTGTRVLVLVLAPLAAVVAAGHLLSVLASQRLR